MKESSISFKVSQTLKEFEALEELSPSPEWDMSLVTKLKSLKPESGVLFSKTRFAAVVIFFLLVNIGFILNTLFNSTGKSNARNKELQLISNELLINQTTSSN